LTELFCPRLVVISMDSKKVEKYWQEVQQITQELEPGMQFSSFEAIDQLNDFLETLIPASKDHVTKTKINYLHTEGILHPVKAGGGKERTTWRYTSDDVRRALLIELLKRKEGLGVQAGKAWLEKFEEEQEHKANIASREELQAPIPLSPGSLPPTAVSSAYALLTNRVLGTLMLTLNFQVNGKIPVDSLVAIRPFNSDIDANLPSSPTWAQVRNYLERGNWSLAASDNYSKLYIYRDLRELQERRHEITDRLEEYKWYYLNLKSVDGQCYEMLLGLWIQDTKNYPNLIPEFEQAIRSNADGIEPIIRLSNFPGLSTLLWITFINRPEIAGGTPLAALVEIIAGTSDLLDYAVILVPEYDSAGNPEYLRIQEYSSGFRTQLSQLVGIHVDVGKFLTGWCYKYNQSIVVEPTIENDPRVAFFEEEGSPNGAAAIPATASGQYPVGVIYVASHRKQKVFSDELLACLEALGCICGDMIARDQIEIETVRSVGQLSTQRQALFVKELRDLAKMVIDRATKGVNPAEAVHRWIYLLTLNIEATMQDTITQWLCEQGIEITREFLSNRLFGQSAFLLPTHTLPVEYCQIRPDRYAFAILRALDIPEAEYKLKIARLETELNQLVIGGISPRFYPSAVTFRFDMFYRQLQENGVDSLVDDVVNRVDERLTAGLTLKRGHQYLYTAHPDQAASSFDDTLRYVPNSWYALKHLAEARMLQGTSKTIDQAIEKCRKAVNLNPNYASAHCLLADCLSYQGQFSEAFVHYEQAIALDSTRTEFFSRYGLTLASMTESEYEEALNYLKSKIPELFLQRRYLDKPWDEAIARFGQTRDLDLAGKDTNSPEAQEILAEYYYRKGQAYLHAGQIDEALEEFTMGRKHSPNNLNLDQSYLFALQQRRKKGV
jgi:tetratricopeptide (TPR) repeat protein/DNA-binding transcriptional MerR regulator